MGKVTIYNGDCEKAMAQLADEEVDFILTSPPYNTSRTSEATGATLSNTTSSGYPTLRYDVAIDGMPNDKFVDWQVRLFIGFDRVLARNGCVAYNISYGAENTECYIETVYGILKRTPFTLADRIVWKKSNALPNNVSPNRLTRICEDVFIFCRRGEEGTFFCNQVVINKL